MIILLVVLVVLVAVPLGIGMTMGSCPQCVHPGFASAWGICFGIISISLLLVQQLVWGGELSRAALRSHVIASRVERPPRPI